MTTAVSEAVVEKRWAALDPRATAKLAAIEDRVRALAAQYRTVRERRAEIGRQLVPAEHEIGETMRLRQGGAFLAPDMKTKARRLPEVRPELLARKDRLEAEVRRLVTEEATLNDALAAARRVAHGCRDFLGLPRENIG
jgi:chromosome segregation ATPase